MAHSCGIPTLLQPIHQPLQVADHLVPLAPTSHRIRLGWYKLLGPGGRVGGQAGLRLAAVDVGLIPRRIVNAVENGLQVKLSVGIGRCAGGPG